MVISGEAGGDGGSGEAKGLHSHQESSIADGVPTQREASVSCLLVEAADID